MSNEVAMVESEIYASDMLEELIDFFTTVKQSKRISEEIYSESNEELQDLEHYIELEACSAARAAQCVKRLKTVRQKRRKAKNDLEIYTPICGWLESNSAMVEGLKALLGVIRKIETKQEHRVYAVRTHVLDGITEKSHLSRAQ